MKRQYTLEYKNGYGEQGSIVFNAYSFYDACAIAKSYCRRNFIKIYWLVSDTGNKYYI